MRLSGSKIRKELNKGLDVPVNELRIQEAIRQSEKAFLETEDTGTLPRLDFLFQQSRYIKKRWWVVQGLLLFLLWVLLRYTDSNFYIQRCIGIAAPLFVVMIVPEIWKNRTANAMEIECTAYYSLRQIYAARMTLFAVVDLLLLSVFLCLVLCTTQLPPGTFIIQFFIPMNVTSCICFQTLYSKKGSSQTFSLLLCMVWCVVWIEIVLKESIYMAISLPVWWILLALSCLYLGYCICKGQKKYLRIWEVKPSWN